MIIRSIRFEHVLLFGVNPQARAFIRFFSTVHVRQQRLLGARSKACVRVHQGTASAKDALLLLSHERNRNAWYSKCRSWRGAGGSQCYCNKDRKTSGAKQVQAAGSVLSPTSDLSTATRADLQTTHEFLEQSHPSTFRVVCWIRLEAYFP